MMSSGQIKCRVMISDENYNYQCYLSLNSEEQIQDKVAMLIDTNSDGMWPFNDVCKYTHPPTHTHVYTFLRIQLPLEFVYLTVQR